MQKNNSQHIVITGVTKGLGRAMVDKFIKLGHTVSGCGRSEQKIKELHELFPEKHLFSVVDVANGNQGQQWSLEVLEKTGLPDFLINNASIMNRTAPLWEISENEFSQIININIKGTFNTIRSFVPVMIEKKSGIIVNLSSGWGRSTAPEVAPYCTTKWAIEGLSQAMSQELPAGLAVIALNPGVINTEMLRSCWGEHALNYQSPVEWAEKAVPFILNFGPSDNGKSVSV